MLKKLLMKINSKSVSFRWMISYFLLIALFVISMAISITCFYSAQRAETVRSNRYILNIVEKDYEKFFDDVKGIINMSLTQRQNNIYSFIPDVPNEEGREYKYAQIKDQLNKTIRENELYEKAFLYLKEHDVIISTTNVMDTELFYKAYVAESDIDYQDWIEFISTDTLNSVAKLKGKDETKYYYVAKTAISLSTRRENVSLVFIMNNAYAKSINENVFATNGAEILMDDGVAVYNFSDNINAESFVAKSISDSHEVSYTKIDGKKYVYMATNNIFGRNYILLIPMHGFYNNLITTIVIQLVMLLIISLLMAVMAMWFSKMHLSPVEELLNQLNSERNKLQSNEYAEISNRISELIMKKNIIEQKYTGQNKYFYQNIVTRWLKGDISVSDFAEYGVELETLGFKNAKYLVAVFEVTSIGFFADGIETAEDFEIAKYALNNVVSELINKNYYCYSIDNDGRLTCIVNPDKSVSDEKIELDFLGIYDYTKDFVLKNLGFDFKMAFGTVKTNPDELNYSYNEAVSVLEYNIAYGNDELVHGSPAATAVNIQGALFAETNKLVHKIKDGSDKELDELTERWCKLYVSYRTKNPNAMQYGLYGLVDASLRECMTLTASNEEMSDFIEYLAGKYKFENTKSYERIKSKLSDMFFEIRRFIDDRAGTNHLVDRIMKYIEDNYSDHDMSVAKIAEHFNLNVAYLSSTFKKSANCGMLEKINRIRCDKSSELLVHTKKNINEIAFDVGYENVHTYIRAFKKYYSVTPTQYRSKHGRR